MIVTRLAHTGLVVLAAAGALSLSLGTAAHAAATSPAAAVVTPAGAGKVYGSTVRCSIVGGDRDGIGSATGIGPTYPQARKNALRNLTKSLRPGEETYGCRWS